LRAHDGMTHWVYTKMDGSSLEKSIATLLLILKHLVYSRILLSYRNRRYIYTDFHMERTGERKTLLEVSSLRNIRRVLCPRLADLLLSLIPSPLLPFTKLTNTKHIHTHVHESSTMHQNNKKKRIDSFSTHILSGFLLLNIYI